MTSTPPEMCGDNPGWCDCTKCAKRRDWFTLQLKEWEDKWEAQTIKLSERIVAIPCDDDLGGFAIYYSKEHSQNDSIDERYITDLSNEELRALCSLVKPLKEPIIVSGIEGRGLEKKHLVCTCPCKADSGATLLHDKDCTYARTLFFR